MRPKINSNDFGRFLDFLSRIEFEFCRRGNCFQKQFVICVFWSSFTQCDRRFTHVLWHVYTCVDVSQQVQTQTTYTAQTHHTSIPTVVVSLMIHDNMFVYIYVYVHVHGYMDLGMCVCVYVFLT